VQSAATSAGLLCMTPCGLEGVPLIVFPRPAQQHHHNRPRTSGKKGGQSHINTTSMESRPLYIGIDPGTTHFGLCLLRCIPDHCGSWHALYWAAVGLPGKTQAEKHKSMIQHIVNTLSIHLDTDRDHRYSVGIEQQHSAPGRAMAAALQAHFHTRNTMFPAGPQADVRIFPVVNLHRFRVEPMDDGPPGTSYGIRLVHTRDTSVPKEYRIRKQMITQCVQQMCQHDIIRDDSGEFMRVTKKDDLADACCLALLCALTTRK
jgi:Holliday junction resolvasome RuvABC endonuclease subunit